jgi:coenzyme F420-reducing hydrogenase delta subunit
VKKLLAALGIDPARVEMFNLSAAQGPRWAEICTQFVEKMRSFGPSPVAVGLRRLKCTASGGAP